MAGPEMANETTQPRRNPLGVPRFTASIRARLLLAFVLIALLPVAGVSVTLALVGWQNGQQQAINQLESLARIKEAEIDTWADGLETDLDAVLSASQVMPRILMMFRAETQSESGVFWMRGHFQQEIEQTAQFTELFLVDLTGTVILSTDVAQEGGSHKDQAYFLEGLKGFYVELPVYSDAINQVSMVVARPIAGPEGQPLGILAGRVNTATLQRMMGERGWMGLTGEIYLVDRNGVPLTPLRFGDLDARAALTGGAIAPATQTSGAMLYDDYRGVPVIGIHHWLPDLQVMLIAKQDQSEAFGITISLLTAIIYLAFVAMVIAILASVFVARGIARPIAILARTTERVAGGNLDLTVDVVRSDEIGALAQSFNTMTTQLRGLVGNLEARVETRTRDLTAISEIGRAATQIRDRDLLLPQIVNLIRDRLGFYHVQVFLLDDTGNHAVLAASTGAAGEELLRRRHSLPVGSASVIGQVTQTGEPIIALDTEDAAVPHRPNPLLPDTRSEMALPLRVGERIIGALDVQSTEPRAFDAYHVNLFQSMADQIAVAISNATLLGELEARVQEIEALNRQLIGETWRRHLENYPYHTLAFTASLNGIEPAGTPTPQETRALSSDSPVVLYETEAVRVALPVRYGGSVIGVVEFTMGRDEYNDEKLALAQMLADRLGVSAESARLFEQTRRQTQREQIIGTVGVALQGHDSLEAVLRTAAVEMSKALGARRSALRLRVPDMAPSADDNGARHGDEVGEEDSV